MKDNLGDELRALQWTARFLCEQLLAAAQAFDMRACEVFDQRDVRELEQHAAELRAAALR